MSRLGRFLRRLWPRRLMGQTIVLLLVALFTAQIVSAFILRGETRSFYRGAETRFLAERMSPVASLLRQTPPGLHDQVARAFSSRRTQFWLSDGALLDQRQESEDDDERARSRDLAARIVEELNDPASGSVRVFMRHGDLHDMDEHGQRFRPMAGMPHHAADADVYMSVDIGGGRWVNAAVDLRGPRRLISTDGWITFLLTAVVISIFVVFALRRITRPLASLSAAAGKLGRGEQVAPLAEEGPADVRETIRAFNEMQERLRRFVQDRTRMLAAISHDLRTPITSLRLRAEMIEDDETRDKMIQTLDEMQNMAEASLAFAREEAADEETRATDLAALIGAIAEDLGELGYSIETETPDRLIYPCRPTALRRALVNLIENAARYGEHARVSLAKTDNGIRIRIDDDGPGIPDADLERVFEPFVRLEESRSTETGGIGLGMAIARDIVHRHGGDVILENRPEGGLRATITLPRPTA